MHASHEALSITPDAPRSERLEILQRLVRRMERGDNLGTPHSLGIPAIDMVLQGGLANGAMHQVVGRGDGAATAFTAWLAGRSVTSQSSSHGGMVVWIRASRDRDTAGWPLYGPGLAAWGMPVDRLMMVEATRRDDVLWAAEEALRDPAVASVVVQASRMSLTAARRLQLAAEQGRTLGMMLACDQADLVPVTPAFSRWRVFACPSRATVDGAPGVGEACWTLGLERNRLGRTGAWLVAAGRDGLDLISTTSLHRDPPAGAAPTREGRSPVPHPASAAVHPMLQVA